MHHLLPHLTAQIQAKQEATNTKTSINHHFQEEDANIDATLLECITFAIHSICKAESSTESFLLSFCF